MNKDTNLGGCIPLLTRILIQPELIKNLDELEWDQLLRQARAANLLGRIQQLCQDLSLLDSVPRRVRYHLVSEDKYFSAHRLSVTWELENIRHHLGFLDTPVVILKGAAYLKAGCKAGLGRTFSDIDILVEKSRLNEVEKALNRNGWLSSHHDEYYQRYYRKWMHELPPLKHYLRKTLLDVHHNILPETARNTPDIRKMIDAAIPVDDEGVLFVLSPVDMLIHSATHLFHEGELDHGLRDLVDIDLLVSEYRSDDFWDKVCDRAEELGLVWPIYHALTFLQLILQRSIPVDTIKRLEKNLSGRWGNWLVRKAYQHAFLPRHPACHTAFTPIALWLLYIRGHWLRMPMNLLIPHLVRKAFVKQKQE